MLPIPCKHSINAFFFFFWREGAVGLSEINAPARLHLSDCIWFCRVMDPAKDSPTSIYRPPTIVLCTEDQELSPRIIKIPYLLKTCHSSLFITGWIDGLNQNTKTYTWKSFLYNEENNLAATENKNQLNLLNVPQWVINFGSIHQFLFLKAIKINTL